MHSSLTTRTAWTTERSSRNGASVDHFIVHHAATTNLDEVLRLFQPGGREVSANYAVKDAQIVACVPEEERAWTSAAAAWDARAITVETANESAGGDWPISEASFDSLARLIADCASRHGFPIDDDHVLTHQELFSRFGASYATACPGPWLQSRKAQLIAKARSYADASDGPTVPTTVPDEAAVPRSSWQPTDFGIADDGFNPSQEQWKIVQDWLRRLGRYDGPVDGVPGENTWKGIQITVRDRAGYTGPVDGVPGSETAKNMQVYAQEGGYDGPVDGKLGAASWAGFIARLSS